MRRIDFAIVADDLTGAADSGVQFARNGYRTAVFFQGERPKTGDLDVVVLDTDSRAKSKSEARKRVELAGESVRESEVILKKIDSTLRGNLASEIEALMLATDLRCAVVAPAFPPGGRTTVNGRQLLNNVPIHETELARDPKTPVTESDLSRILATLFPVALIGVEDLPDERRIGAMISESRCVVSDATEFNHLSALVQAIPDPSEVLWVGSAGLAGALAEAYPGSRLSDAPDFAAKTVLAVVGSLSGVSREQLRVAVEGGYAVSVSLDRDSGEVIRKARLALERGEDVIVHSPEPDGSLSSSEITESLAGVVSGLEGSFDALVLTGGDTAVGVARRLGATGMEVYGEVEAGVPCGTLVGAVDYPVVTKAGGFGGPKTLCQAISFLKGEVL